MNRSTTPVSTSFAARAAVVACAVLMAVATPISIGKTVFEDYHANIQCPITALAATDDEIATRANVKDLLRQHLCQEWSFQIT